MDDAPRGRGCRAENRSCRSGGVMQAARPPTVTTYIIFVFDRMSLTPGTRLGNYEIIGLLGAGGMGEVYRAHDPRLQREVAVKTLRSPATDELTRARVWREARAAARINHPGVCQIYDVGEAGTGVFIVMELLDGEPLGHRLKDGALPLDDAVRIALGILGAVDALHRRDIVHRDLKPSNVFLTGSGVKLLDFGLAKARDLMPPEHTMTATGTVVGTPRYMAPEQWTEEPPDPRTDLFAVGSLLFEMLTGAPAFPGNDLMQIYHAIMSEHPPALAGSAVVVAVDGVIHRALEKRPEDRYPTADAMAQALRAALTFTASASSPAVVRPTTRLIVLPFRMLRPDADLDFLSFSLPDAIVGSLAGLQSLIVRSTHAGTKYAGDGIDLKALASEAGVDAVVCGTLLRAGDQLRVSAQLLAAPAGTILWSETVQVAIRNLFDVQDQLARAIVQSLALPLSSREKKRLGHDLPASA